MNFQTFRNLFKICGEFSLPKDIKSVISNLFLNEFVQEITKKKFCGVFVEEGSSVQSSDDDSSFTSHVNFPDFVKTLPKVSPKDETKWFKTKENGLVVLSGLKNTKETYHYIEIKKDIDVYYNETVFFFVCKNVFKTCFD